MTPLSRKLTEARRPRRGPQDPVKQVVAIGQECGFTIDPEQHMEPEDGGFILYADLGTYSGSGDADVAAQQFIEKLEQAIPGISQEGHDEIFIPAS